MLKEISNLFNFNTEIEAEFECPHCSLDRAIFGVGSEFSTEKSCYIGVGYKPKYKAKNTVLTSYMLVILKSLTACWDEPKDWTC